MKRKTLDSRILTINTGSSSIKFALFNAADSLTRILEGTITRIGLPNACFQMKGVDPADNFSRIVAAPNHTAANNLLIDWFEKHIGLDAKVTVGHRIVQGGLKYSEPQLITPKMIAALRELSSLDPGHVPEEIRSIEALYRRFPALSQIACFDTAFHHDMPRVAQMLAIPRRFEAQGVRRYGFHGLSYSFLMEELSRVAGPEAVKGRVILAHLGSGASLAAVRDGKSLDTSMG
ncbi:MAG TPA: acetate/propionate family kinase, partial [Candidatus Paceibacterota bacterium]|nr:acetate/propionate family kinase [Candidatus Paceibacterota bacterium]